MEGEIAEAAVSAALDVIGNVGSILLPPEMKKSLFKAVGALITGAVDVPVAWLESKAEVIRANTEAKIRVIKSAGEVAAERVHEGGGLRERAIEHVTSRVFREQLNREAITAEAIEALRQEPPAHDSEKNIDTDWLEMFGRLAEQRSDPEMRRYFARMLAGEIRQPGAFSPRTLQVMSTLTPKIADLYSRLCDIAFVWPEALPHLPPIVIAEPFGPPGNSSLQPLGLPYEQLLRLQDAGLITHDLNSWRSVPPTYFVGKKTIGGQMVHFGLPIPSAVNVHEHVRISVVHFTQAGQELFQLVDLKPNPTYLARYASWLTEKFSLVPLHGT